LPITQLKKHTTTAPIQASTTYSTFK